MADRLTHMLCDPEMRRAVERRRRLRRAERAIDEALAREAARIVAEELEALRHD